MGRRRERAISAVSYLGAKVAWVDAAVWTAIGLLAATSLGSLFHLGSRMDALGARIDALAARMDAGFARVDARFDTVDTRLDALGARLDAHVDRHAS